MKDDLTKLRAEMRQLVLSASWQDKEWGLSMPVDEVAALLDALDVAEREPKGCMRGQSHDGDTWCVCGKQPVRTI